MTTTSKQETLYWHQAERLVPWLCLAQLILCKGPKIMKADADIYGRIIRNAKITLN